MATTSIEKSGLGRSGLMVSRVCYGTGPIGHMPEVYGHGSTEELAYATVRAIFDGPSNFMDTSRNYGAGRSEERIGHVILERGGIPMPAPRGERRFVRQLQRHEQSEDRDPKCSSDGCGAGACRRAWRGRGAPWGALGDLPRL